MIYELLYIVPTPYTEKDLPDIQKNVNQVLEGFGAKITKEDNLGNRKLAYPIKKIRRGFYIAVTFEIEPDKLNPAEQKLKLMPEVLRFQTIKLKTTKRIERVREKRPAVKLETATTSDDKKEKLDLKTLGEKIDKLLEM